jgi:hypothetical protein
LCTCGMVRIARPDTPFAVSSTPGAPRNTSVILFPSSVVIPAATSGTWRSTSADTPLAVCSTRGAAWMASLTAGVAAAVKSCGRGDKGLAECTRRTLCRPQWVSPGA